MDSQQQSQEATPNTGAQQLPITPPAGFPLPNTATDMAASQAQQQPNDNDEGKYHTATQKQYIQTSSELSTIRTPSLIFDL